MNDPVYPKFRWFILFAYIIITTSTSFSYIAPAPFVVEISKSTGADLGVVTAATMMSFSLFMCILAFIGGFLIDMFGVIRMWIISLPVLALGSLLMPVIGNTIPGIVFCRLLHAAGTGPIMASVAAISAQRFKMKERTYIAAFQGFSVSLGIAIGLYFSPKILAIVGGWAATLAWTAVFPATAMVFGLIVLFGPKPPATHTIKPEESDKKSLPGAFKKALVYSTVYVLALIGFIDSWSAQTYNVLMPGLYSADPPVGLGLGAMGSVKLALGSFFMMAGMLVAPVFTENIFKGNPKPTIFMGLAIAGAFILSVQKLTPTTGDFILVGAPCVVMFFLALVNPTIFGYVAKQYPGEVGGRLGGFMMFFIVLGATFGHGISSYILSKTGFYWLPMLLPAIVAFFGAVTVFFLKPPKGFESISVPTIK